MPLTHQPDAARVLVSINGLSYCPSGKSASPILGKIELTVAASERLAIIGANGVGKSTLLRLISGDRTLSGISLGQIVYSPEGFAHPSSLRYVRQRPTLFPWLCVRANIAFHTSLAAMDTRIAQQAIDDHMGEFGCRMLAQKYPMNLSGGEAQRVALAQSLFSPPSLLLLDEPFSSMDVPGKTAMIAKITHYWIKHQFAFVLVSHDYRDVLQLTDRILVLSGSETGSVIANEIRIDPTQRENVSYIKEMLWSMSEATHPKKSEL